jgi:uncharacterized membrane protein
MLVLEMNRPLAIFRRIGARWALLPSVLLLLALVIGGAHSHARESGAHPCAICSLSNASATPVAVAAPVQSVTNTERVILAPALAPRAASVATPGCRAPPQA